MNPEDEGYEPDLLVADNYWTAIPNHAIGAVGVFGLTATGFVVYCALRTYLHGAGGVCWPGRERVCRDYDIPVRTFQRALTNLQECGMLEVTKSTYMRQGVKITRNVYRFPDEANWHKAGASLALGSNQNWHSGLTKIGTRYKEERESVENEAGELEGLFEPPAPKPLTRKPGSAIPADLELTPSMKAYALDKLPGLNVALEFEHFKNWHAENKTKGKDWAAAWRTWVIREVKHRATRVPQIPAQAARNGGLSYRDPYLYPVSGAK